MNTKNYLPYLKLGWMQVKQWNEKSLENAQKKKKTNEVNQTSVMLLAGIDNLLKAYSLQSKNVEINIKIGEVPTRHCPTKLLTSPSPTKAYLMNEDDTHNVDEAIGYLTNALTLDEKNYDCLISLGKAYEKKGDLKKAISFSRIAVDLPDSNPNLNSIFFLGTLYL